ncbi:MAG: hypothetical protein HEQ25_04030 [Dolichospermum sp. DET73]|nr:hypothetical protein [Dolichospermum sp. DET73]
MIYYLVPPMNPKYTKIKFPLWQYLNQPLCSLDIEPVWNPQRFAILWRIQLLERCWRKKSDSKGKQQS